MEYQSRNRGKPMEYQQPSQQFLLQGQEAQGGEGDAGEGSMQGRSCWNEEFSQDFSVPAFSQRDFSPQPIPVLPIPQT